MSSSSKFSRNSSASSSSSTKSTVNRNEEQDSSTHQTATQPNPDFNVTHYFQTNALKSNQQYDNIVSSSKSQSEYLHSIISRAESELTKHNHQVVSDQTVYSTEEGADPMDDEEDQRKKRKRTNYKDPERLAILTEAVNVLVGRLNSDQPLDMRSVSKRFNIPYNTLRDNYLK